MRNRILFLDDDPNKAAVAYQRWPREKCDNTIWASTAKATIFVLNDYATELLEVHLDHDLGGEEFVNSIREDCGMEIVRWLESCSKTDLKAFEGTKFICHDHNLRAARNMTVRLKTLGLAAKQIPFGESEVRFD